MSLNSMFCIYFGFEASYFDFNVGKWNAKRKGERRIQHGEFVWSKIVNGDNKSAKVIDYKYDLLDWSYTVFPFEDSVMDLRYFRNYHRVRLIMNKAPMTIEEHEKTNSNLMVETST